MTWKCARPALPPREAGQTVFLVVALCFCRSVQHVAPPFWGCSVVHTVLPDSASDFWIQKARRRFSGFGEGSIVQGKMVRYAQVGAHQPPACEVYHHVQSRFWTSAYIPVANIGPHGVQPFAYAASFRCWTFRDRCVDTYPSRVYRCAQPAAK